MASKLPAKTISIYWLRRDFRLRDNPALNYVVKNSEKLVVVYIDDPSSQSWSDGGATKWYLHHSLLSFQRDLKDKGLSLVIRKGEALKELKKLVKETSASNLVWNRLYEPELVERDKSIKAFFKSKKVEVNSFKSCVLLEPWECFNKSDKPYKVFTPFWREFQKRYNHKGTLSVPKNFPKSLSKVESLKISDLNLLPEIDWDEGFSEYWNPGEANAKKEAQSFIKRSANEYSDNRNIPSIDGTSMLSAALHFGEISPNQVWSLVLRGISKGEVGEREGEVFLRQLGWRDFAHQLLFNFPYSSDKPLNKEYSLFPWSKNKKYLKAWQKGETGIPIVDAGMRQLWHTGWMHNRVRMIVGSFLVKNLLQPWQEGADWFWDTLVDADLPNNSMGWQWVAGSGADAAPYFRVFNPVLQGQRFDKEGEYVRKWVPELSEVPKKWIHNVWDAPEKVLAEADVILGESYPKPIVDLKKSRNAALDAYREFKNHVEKSKK